MSLLVAGMRFVQHLGGKRRRGKGRCRLEIDHITGGYDWKVLLDYLPKLAKAREKAL